MPPHHTSTQQSKSSTLCSGRPGGWEYRLANLAGPVRINFGIARGTVHGLHACCTLKDWEQRIFVRWQRHTRKAKETAAGKLKHVFKLQGPRTVSPGATAEAPIGLLKNASISIPCTRTREGVKVHAHTACAYVLAHMASYGESDQHV